LKLIALQ